jgi:hypothetical protein
MEMTIEIPEKVVERAAAFGLPVSTLVSQALDQFAEEPIPPGFVQLGVPAMTRADATAEIREIASKHTPGGLKIKDLIEEGRRL